MGTPSRLRVAYHLLEVGGKLRVFCGRKCGRKTMVYSIVTRYWEGTPLPNSESRKRYFASH